MKKTIILATFALFQSCGNNDNLNSTTTSRSSSFNTVYEALAESAPEMGTSSLSQNYWLTSINETITLWSNASTNFMGVSSTSRNPKDYVGDLFDSTVDQSMLERARMPFLMSCCMDILANKTGDLFTEGTQTVTFTNSVVGVCGTQAEVGGMVGETMTFVVTTLSDRTNYDQRIFFDHASNTMFSTEDQWMYIKNNSEVLNFMHIGDTSAGFDGSQIDVKSIAYDKTTGIGSFQGLSNSPDRIYRIYLNPVSDDVRAFAFKTNGSGVVSVNIASTYEDQSHAALSMSYSGLAAPYNTDKTDQRACIATADASIAEDDTVTCTANSKTVLATSGADTLETAVSAFNGATLRSDAAAGSLSDNLPTFNATTILSSAIQL
jgi:hypothetical protein